MNGYLILLKHHSGPIVVNAIMANSIEEAKEKTIKCHGELSKIIEVEEMNDRGLIVYASNPGKVDII